MVNQRSKPTIPLEHPKLHILIVGGGVGGLMLAVLLERAGISYKIFEKASEFKPLGSAMLLRPNVLAFLDQIGLYTELQQISKPFRSLHVHSLDLETKKLQVLGSHEHKLDMEESFGYPTLILSRPDLFKILLNHIPCSKIMMGKRILSIQQNHEGVMLRAADGSTHHGQIAIGADGCYSPTRQSIFAGIEKRKDTVPTLDKGPLKYEMDSVVGITRPLDLNQFPNLNHQEESCQVQVVLSKQEQVSIFFIPLPNHRIGWMVNKTISKTNSNLTNDQGNFARTAWGPEAAIEMCQEFASYPIPAFGKDITVQLLMDHTDPECISKVMLEEKLFETWHDGRTCLIGDACHKVLPFAGNGAAQAMLDALKLANLLYDIPSSSFKDIKHLFAEYQVSRKQLAKTAIDNAASASSLFHTRGFIGDRLRNMVFNKLPDWVIRKSYEKICRNRPQVTFLPFLEHRGLIASEVEEHSQRYLMEREAATRTAMVEREDAVVAV